MQVWNVPYATRWKYRTQKWRKNRHLRTIAQLCRAISSQLRHVSTIAKKLLNSNMCSTCSHNMVNLGPLTAKIRWRVWDTPTNFNRFRFLPSLVQRRRSPQANETVHDVRPSSGLVHCIYLFGGSCPLTEFCPVQYSSLVFYIDTGLVFTCKWSLHELMNLWTYWQRYSTARGSQPKFAALYNE